MNTEINYHSEFWISRRNDSVNLLIRPSVSIVYSEDSVAGVEIRKRARGANSRDARQFAEDINYSLSQQDSMLIIDPVYRLLQRSRFHAQQVDVVIDLPAGTVVYLDKNLKEMLHNTQNTEDTWSGDLVGDDWVMTPEGLTRVLKSEPVAVEAPKK